MEYSAYFGGAEVAQALGDFAGEGVEVGKPTVDGVLGFLRLAVVLGQQVEAGVEDGRDAGGIVLAAGPGKYAGAPAIVGLGGDGA